MKREGNAEEPRGGSTGKTYSGWLRSCGILYFNKSGEPLKPLSKVASGGELSRIILALKAFF